jgi:hypothetical protein
MKFNLVRFLRQQNIEVVSKGPNVKKGNVYIRCPMCGSDDPSQHMGIEEDTFKWACWRNPRHRGIKPHRLIKAILKCSWQTVDRVVGDQTQYPDGWKEFVESARKGTEEIDSTIVSLNYPDEFRPITSRRLTKRFYDYVAGRFDAAAAVIDCYDLRCALTGDFKDRIIIPLFFRDKLVGWTARAIADAQIRYLSHPEGSTIKKIIFDYDLLKSGGNNLFITEGPFDAINVDFHSRWAGSAATCLFSNSATEEQCVLIASIANRWDRIINLLDADSVHLAMSLQSKLSLIGVEVWFLPDGVKDPGELSREQVAKLAVADHSI